mgnify:CR=1 FL=1
MREKSTRNKTKYVRRAPSVPPHEHVQLAVPVLLRELPTFQRHGLAGRRSSLTCFVASAKLLGIITPACTRSLSDIHSPKKAGVGGVVAAFTHRAVAAPVAPSHHTSDVGGRTTCPP